MQDLFRENQDAYLKGIYDEILTYLTEQGNIIEDLPKHLDFIKDSGEAFSKAYPIQGILKYHGFVGPPENRIAYFPSISLNNDCAYTISYVKLDNTLKQDKIMINGALANVDDFERVQHALDFMRKTAKVETKAIYVSRNFLTNSKTGDVGKGLGTSAAASSSLAQATASIIYDNNPKILENRRMMSIFSRYLSGSGCRSSTGGISMWLSHPKASSFESFSIRLDNKKHSKFLDNITLLTIPIVSPLKTTQAHVLAPISPFFPAWLMYRKKLVIDILKALDNNDLDVIGELAEYDTMCLHSITMTAAPNKQLIAWEPDTIKIMHRVRKLRKGGFTVYFTIDTGPSVILLAKNKDVNAIINELTPLIPDLPILKGKIGGPAEVIKPTSAEAKELENDIATII